LFGSDFSERGPVYSMFPLLNPRPTFTILNF